jgi:formylglycine-generating enzyme required for sulfatase activity
MSITPITPVLSKKNAFGVVATLFLALVLAGCWGGGDTAGGGAGGASLAKLEASMVPVSGGTFTIGCREGVDVDLVDGAAVPDTNCLKPANRETTVADFHICIYEVTQGLWKDVMGASNNPSAQKGDDLPVTNVTGAEINAFFTELNSKRADGPYTYRLPTESEWEYAARGGANVEAFVYSGGDDPRNVAWYGKDLPPVEDAGNSGGSLHAVGSRLPNILGLYDMSGNAWEVVQVGNTNRAERGGSWFGPKRYCRVTYRNYLVNAGGVDPVSDRGFRIAATAK